MKKVILSFLAVLLCVSLLTACGECEHEWNGILGECKLCGETCAHQFNEKGKCATCKFACAHEEHDAVTLVCTTCGLQEYHNFVDNKCTKCDKTTIFAYGDLDPKWTEPCQAQGTVVKVAYDTYAYSIEKLAGLEEKSLPVEKYAYVYLPHGYNESEQYNVLYLIHGTGEVAETWFGLRENDTSKNLDNLKLLDNLMATGVAEPTIIVTPTFYTYVSEDSEYAQYNDLMVEEALTDFGRELYDLVAVIETTYSTYANSDVSHSNLVETREYRAYAGLSRGGRISCGSIVRDYLDIYGYIGSFSSAWFDYEWIDESLNGKFSAYTPYFWYHGNGSIDTAHDKHIQLYSTILEQNPERFIEDQNIVMVDKKGFGHDASNWHIDLYNIFQVFFKQQA